LGLKPEKISSILRPKYKLKTSVNMKRFFFAMATAIITAVCVSSCGGGSSTSGESMLFGKVPAIVEDYNTKNDRIKEDYKKCDSESEMVKLVDKANTLEAETFAKAEDAGQAWSGSTLDLASDAIFEVKTPITVTFDGFFSKSDFTAQYDLAGEAVIAKDCIWEPLTDNEKSIVEMTLKDGIQSYSTAIVNIIGLDAEGNEITSDRIGYVKLAIIDGKVGVAVNTPVTLESLVMSNKSVAQYPLVKSLKLGFAQYNIK